MKSSGAVFTRQNPFPPASPVGKTYYHPSRIQSLSKKKRKTSLSPVRPNQRASPPLQTCSLSPHDEHLLGKPDHLFTCLHPHTDGQPSFSESWPSTDRGSSPANTTASSDMERPKQSEPPGKSIVSSDQRDQQDSVLAKYIERFRHGRPQSREERQQLPFWWMSPSPLPSSSTPTEATDKDVILPLKDDHASAILSPVGQHQHGSTPSPCRGSFSVSACVLSDTSHGDLDDPEILQLQERASRLLQKSDGSIPISSEGLGCSDFSSPVSIDEPVRRPLLPSLMESSTAAVNASSASHHAGPSQKTSVTPSLVPHIFPGDDILFQWRLRRKMEQAREWPQSQQYSSLHRSTFSWQNPSLHQPPVTGQAHKLQQNIQPPETAQRVTPTFISSPQPKAKEAHGPHPGPSASPPFPVSSSSVSKLQSDTDAHVPAHMHLLCDVLPCPTQSSLPSSQQRSSRRIDGFRTKVVPKKNQQVLEYSTDSCTEEPIAQHMSSPPPDSSGTTEEEWPFHHRRAERKNKQKDQTKESEKNEKRTAMSSRKQKKSTSRGPKKVKSWPEQPSSRNGGQLERCQGLSSESCTGNRAPPPSPIHSALGQVVSEVLFPTLDSSPAQRTPVLSDSPPYTPSAPPQSPVPSGNAENTMEVISQLLREAEDSDEKEFEDDPLLQVLRKQRKWVKEQISEVDSMLDEFQEE